MGWGQTVRGVLNYYKFYRKGGDIPAAVVFSGSVVISGSTKMVRDVGLTEMQRYSASFLNIVDYFVSYRILINYTDDYRPTLCCDLVYEVDSHLSLPGPLNIACQMNVFLTKGIWGLV